MDENIFDEIDLKEKEMLNDGRREAAELLILDQFSYDQLKYELGMHEDYVLEMYHGYKVVVANGTEKCVRFV